MRHRGSVGPTWASGLAQHIANQMRLFDVADLAVGGSEARPGQASLAPRLLLLCRCSRMVKWSARSLFIGKKCVRSLRNKQRCYRISPLKPSSPSRTRGCSTSCGKSLQQQTATSKVLQVISLFSRRAGARFRIRAGERSKNLQIKFGVLHLYEDDLFFRLCSFDVPSELVKFLQKRGPFRPRPGTNLDKMLQTNDVVRVTDVTAKPKCRSGRGGNWA